MKQKSGNWKTVTTRWSIQSWPATPLELDFMLLISTFAATEVYLFLNCVGNKRRFYNWVFEQKIKNNQNESYTVYSNLLTWILFRDLFPSLSNFESSSIFKSNVFIEFRPYLAYNYSPSQLNIYQSSFMSHTVRWTSKSNRFLLNSATRWQIKRFQYILFILRCWFPFFDWRHNFDFFKF